MTDRITADAFIAWQTRLRLSGVATANLLGLSEDTIVRYRTDGVPKKKTKITGLAMAAIANGTRPYPPQDLSADEVALLAERRRLPRL
jgi:hypothetical protein